MQAKKKEIKELSLSDLGLEASQGKVTMESLVPVAEGSSAKMIEGAVDDQVTELVRILKEEEKVL
jgi:electron transfer flavoprotein beta subunit